MFLYGAGTSHNPEVFAAHLPSHAFQCTKQIRAAGANRLALPHQRAGPQFFVSKMGLIIIGVGMTWYPGDDTERR